jgi:hypothetical protein
MPKSRAPEAYARAGAASAEDKRRDEIRRLGFDLYTESEAFMEFGA